MSIGYANAMGHEHRYRAIDRNATISRRDRLHGKQNSAQTNRSPQGVFMLAHASRRNCKFASDAIARA